MRYLYFQTKPTLSVAKRWNTPHYQMISLLLRDCSRKEELVQIHAQMIRTRLIEDTFLASRLIASLILTSSKSDIEYARHVFDQIHCPNRFSWNSMIRGYTHHHASKEAVLIFKLMLHRGLAPDSFTYTAIGKAFTQPSTLQTGQMIHGLIIKSGFDSDMFSMSGIVSFYAGCGRIIQARAVFDEMPERDVVLWTSLLSGYAQLNNWHEVVLLFDGMKKAGVQPNRVTISSLLSACGQLQALDKGRWLHSHILENEMESDIGVANSLVSMYAKCGAISRATEVFRRMALRNTLTWNALIGGYVHKGLYEEALTMFHQMIQSDARPDEVTVVSSLSACAQLGDLIQGKLLHTYIVDHKIACDIFVRNALINMYAKCGDLKEAESVFLEMSERDVFSWSTMISGYVQGSCFEKALALFEEMLLSNVEANEVTLVSVLSACAQLGALDRGRQIHEYIEEQEVKKDTCLGNALVDMYAKCGCIEVATQIFHEMPQRDTHSWNAMIGGLATHGHGRKAIDYFNQMQRIGDCSPDSVTLVAVLCACNHAGMVHEGFRYFNSMLKLYGISPGIEHYGCMVDLLGRAGLINEALGFIKRMPITPNSVIWGSLLAACRVHHRSELGERIAQHMMKLAPDDEGAHVLISNLYAEAGKWDGVRRMRDLMESKRLEKSPGCSSIEVDGIVHVFFIGDRLHHQKDLIYLVLDNLALHLKQASYVF